MGVPAFPGLLHSFCPQAGSFPSPLSLGCSKQLLHQSGSNHEGFKGFEGVLGQRAPFQGLFLSFAVLCSSFPSTNPCPWSGTTLIQGDEFTFWGLKMCIFTSCCPRAQLYSHPMGLFPSAWLCYLLLPMPAPVPESIPPS